MEVIVFEKATFYKLIDELTHKIYEQFKVTESEGASDWIDTNEAKKLLGVKSRVKMQQLRDVDAIQFTKIGKTYQYSKNSILDFLNQNSNRYATTKTIKA
ncbi:helix-turn-helix domain-containing protein [Aquimarina sp. ERC-38]|uniref:helix-turn-helix domain-containing protein n=1 Tax=Aquimarina sp. ERC-38 TaxID=2949996 RepID=UPI0022460B20|nr:helix-turn-helix domain-containing protein [Aquimarina sp. ERC-38]UZO81720.1 helix-turn-helix domain-containing protein [Aquimarina sp. ERC-38]